LSAAFGPHLHIRSIAVIRTLIAGAIALALLHACATHQPMGEDIWRAVPHSQQHR
jgi:predicted small secreted protein